MPKILKRNFQRKILSIKKIIKKISKHIRISLPQQLDTEAKAKIATIPEEDRILVTSEGAFKYFSKQYGLTAEYIWEINTDDQGTTQPNSIVSTLIVKDKM